MSFPVFDASLQAVIMSALSNALAQCVQAYKQKVHIYSEHLETVANDTQSLVVIDLATLARFTMVALLLSPPNYAFQKLLEDSFPTTAASTSKADIQNDYENVLVRPLKELSITNTLIKFFIDQILGASVNTLLFIAVRGMFKGMGAPEIMSNIREVHLFYKL